MGIRRCHHRRVSLSHHHVSIFVGAAARSAAFATAAVVAAINAEAPQLSPPQLSVLGDCHPSTVVVIVVIVAVIIVQPPSRL